MKCTNCGNMCDDNAVFCSECGQKIVKNNTQPEAPAADAELEKDMNASAEKEAAAEETVKKTPAFFDDSPTMVLENAADDIPEEEAPEEPKEEEPDPVMDEDIIFPTDSSDEETKEFEAVKTPAPEAPVPDNSETKEMKLPELKKATAPETPIPAAAPVPVPEAPKPFDDNSDTMTMEIPKGGINNAPNAPYSNPVRDHISSEFNSNRQNNGPYNAPEQPVNNWQPNMESGYAEQVPPPPIAPEAAVVKDKKVGGFRLFGASIISIIAIALLFALNLLVCIKFGMTGKMVEKRINKLDLNIILNGEFEGEEVSDNVYNTLGFGSLTHGKADRTEFKKYIKDTNILEYVGENARNYVEYILENKGNDPSITAEDIANDFFKENNDVCKEHFDTKLGSEEIDLIEKRLDENDVSKNLSIKEWHVQNVNYGLSYVSMGMILAIILLLLIMIIIIVDKKGRHVLMFLGNILLAPGILTFIIGIGATLGVMSAFTLSGNVILYAVSIVALPLGVMFLIVGFGEILFAFIFKAIGRGLRRKHKMMKKISEKQNAPVYN